MSSDDERQALPRCRFEKALITGFAGCAEARSRLVGEAIRFECHSRPAARRCDEFLERLRCSAGFVFGVRGRPTVLSNNQSIRLQCGAVEGLASLMPAQAPADGSIDVGSLVAGAYTEFGAIDAVPLDRIMPFVSRYDPRPPRRRRGRDPAPTRS